MLQADLCAFGPSPERAAYLDARVRRHLAGSLAAVLGSVESHVGFEAADAAALLRAVRRGAVPPALFGLYSDLVVAIFDDALEEAPALVASLLDRRWREWPGFRAVTLDDAQLGPGQAMRYRRMLDDDPEVNFPIGPVAPERLPDLAAQAEAALALLAAAAPSLHDEILTLVRELVLVESRAAPDDKEAMVFDGASTFSLWGALFLNAAGAAARLPLALALTHEAAHSHLFGVALGRRLVRNPDSERYASPLRDDARPMDGLVHAAYVLTRMVWCLERLLGSGLLAPEERDLAQRRLAQHRREFAEGLATIAEHASFTPLGRRVFNSAVMAMA